jgi:hypothetical protein
VLLRYELALGKDPQMFRNGLPGRIEMLGDRVWRHGLQGDERNDRPPGRVGYGLENVSFHNCGHNYATIQLRMSSATERFRVFFVLFRG